MQLTCERHEAARAFMLARPLERALDAHVFRGRMRARRWMCWRRISAYLLATYAMAGAAWAIIPAANDAPHAPW